MHLTHNTIVALMWFVVFASGGTIGGLIAWWRLSYRLDECCDCCTCEYCLDEGSDAFAAGQIRPVPTTVVEPPWPGQDVERSGQRSITEPGRRRPDATSPVSGRRTVVLEPGPTIYRALVPLDDEALYGPESHVKPFDSTFIRTVLMDWERRYPIPQDSPNGNM